MDPIERTACLRLMLWFYGTIANNNMAIAMAVSTLVSNDFDSDEPRWPWRPSKRFTIVKALGDVWADEADGGINDELFQFFTRFKKTEVRHLAKALDIPIKYGIDERNGWPKAAVETPEEALLVFLWRAAHPLALGHLIVVFGKSRAWISKIWNGVVGVECWEHSVHPTTTPHIVA